MNKERIYTVIRAPHVSEKSTMATEKSGQVVFKVSVDATKPEVKAAVEKLFNVKVDGVRMVKVKGKTKNRFTGGGGRRSDWKKAYVALAEGQDIDFTSAE